jgi:hypothetical protein
MVGFFELLQNVTTNNYDSLTELHNSKDHCNYSTNKVFSVCYIFISRCLVTEPTMSTASVLTFSPAGATVSQLTHCSNCRLSTNFSAYNISAQTAQKTLFLCCCLQLFPCKHAYLRSRYSVTADVHLLLLSSSSSNGSTCHNILASS